MPILIPLLLKLQCKVANFQLPILVCFAFFLTEPTLLLPWKAEIAGELVLPQSSTHPMTDGRWCINTPVLSALGGITQEYVVRGVPVSPEGNIPFSSSNSQLDIVLFIGFLGCLPILVFLFHSPTGAFFTSQTTTVLKSLSQDQLRGEPKWRRMVKLYPFLASRPDSQSPSFE